MFSLFHEIDETEAEQVRDKIISQGCPRYISTLLKAITSYSTKDYKTYSIMGISVYEHMVLNTLCDVKSYIEKWMLNIPEEDLDKLDRIYIVRDEDIKALGTYTPVLNCISLRWENNHKETSLLFKGKLLGIEKVFYHEIGHHVHRHTFGQDPEQEKEADKYAFKIMQQSHLNLDRAARFISSITKGLDDNWKKGLIGIELKDKETGEKLGNITEDDMEFLMLHLVNEYEGDRNFLY